MDNISFSSVVFARPLRKGKPSHSCGQDELPSVLYNKHSKRLAHPLSLTLNYRSIGKVPDEWRSTIVTPVQTCGPTSIIYIYRPISLTCVASKVMLRVVAVNLLIYLRHRNLINKQQHGFLSGKSTTTNILESLADWTLTLKTDIC